MLRRFLVWITLFTVRTFFREIGVIGTRHIRGERAVLFVANHPNALMDPVVVRLALDREVGFLAKSTLFENPFGNMMMDAFAAVPVYRAQDGNDTSKNDETYVACAHRFAEQRAMVMFPEGVSHSDPQMRKLKTGAARFALRFALTHGQPIDIVPVGLFFEAKDVFRSRVSVAVGEPIDVTEYLVLGALDEFETALQITTRITEALHELVLQAENTEIWEMFVAVARWTHKDTADDVRVTLEEAQRLADAYGKLRLIDPPEADGIAEDVLRFAAQLRSVGIQNPFDIEEVAPSPRRVAEIVIRTILLIPFAAIGTIASFIPYQLFGPLARRVSGSHSDMISSVKAIAGMVFMPLVYLLEALIVGLIWGWAAGVFALILLPLCGLAALRFWEKLERRKHVLHASWLRLTRAEIAEDVRQRRAALTTRIQTGLARVEEDC